MKVGVIFIGTGDYLNFLPNFYESVMKNFLPGIDKNILVFTDGILNDTPEEIIHFKHDHQPWPQITLMRFETLYQQRETLKKFDWIIFLDADTIVVDTVTPEDLFTDKPLIGVHHPCHFLGMPPHNSPPGAFETRKDSYAGVDSNDDISTYYQGCVWGGKTPEVLDMIEFLTHKINDEYENGVVAVWHDESHLNKYYSEHKSMVHTLHPSFAFPEVFKSFCEFKPKIVHLSKNNSEYQK